MEKKNYFGSFCFIRVILVFAIVRRSYRRFLDGKYVAFIECLVIRWLDILKN